MLLTNEGWSSAYLLGVPAVFLLAFLVVFGVLSFGIKVAAKALTLDAGTTRRPNQKSLLSLARAAALRHGIWGSVDFRRKGRCSPRPSGRAGRRVHAWHHQRIDHRRGPVAALHSHLRDDGRRPRNCTIDRGPEHCRLARLYGKQCHGRFRGSALVDIRNHPGPGCHLCRHNRPFLGRS